MIQVCHIRGKEYSELKNNERIDTVKEIAKSAGEIALSHYGRVASRIKADKTIVTTADLEAGNFINEQLKKHFPGYGLVNEETHTENISEKLEEHEYSWIVDPVDGTSAYSKRLPIWCTSIGLMKGREPVLGMIYLPALNEYCYTDEDSPSYFEAPRWGKTELKLDGSKEDLGSESFLIVTSDAHRRLDIDFPGKTRALGSASAAFCLVSRGDAFGAIIRGHIWDWIMGWAILKKAGGDGMMIDGSPIDWDHLFTGERADYMIIAGKENLRQLKNRIKKRNV